MEVEPLGHADVAPVAAAVAAWQRDPSAHVCFVGTDPAEVAEEFAEADAWRDRTLVTRGPDGAVLGVVLADVDEEMGRVWWVGPWGVDAAARRTVLAAAAARLPAGVAEEEFGPDARNDSVAALAAERGATRGTPASVLTLDPLVVSPSRTVTGVEVEVLRPAHRAPVAGLHDTLFPGTHTPGASLVADEGHDLLVAVEGGAPIGYVATEVHPDGSLYVDYLGTASVARRRGVASALIVAALRRGLARGCPRSHLTVRHDAEGARALYLSLGYVEERVIVPWRVGFDLG